MVKKDFLNWHKIKENIENNNGIYFHKREIWRYFFGVNIGFEQDGKGKSFARPVLIFKKFNKEIFWALPISVKNKTGKFYYPIDFKDGVNCFVILLQTCLIDSKRLLDKIGVINKNNYLEIQKTVINLCNL